MKRTFSLGAVVLVMIASGSAQVASHAPSGMSNAAATNLPPAQMAPAMQVSDKPVARVNGAVLTDRDLLREMYAIFPYAQQHNGFPKAQEAAIRQGALEMIIFEELVYQEAVRRQMTIAPEKLNRAEADFRKQFNSPDQYQQYLQVEMQGSERQLRQQMKRSMLIEQLLKNDVENRSAVTQAEVQAYYTKNAARFTLPESFTFQSISVMPPLKPTATQAAEAKKNADAAVLKAKATKNYQDFGLLAEKISEDDFRVNMGDHKAVGRDKLPPQVVKALSAMQPGQVSGLIQIESAYTIIRLNAHSPAKKQGLQEVQNDLKVELQKNKYEKLRSGLAKQLRAKAKIEVV
jgi:peptidyl-prolyl cis-trans isomerase SurA